MSDGLVDILDRLVDTGVAAGGDVTISAAAVDLVELRLQALLASIGTSSAEELSFPQRAVRRELPARIDSDESSLQEGMTRLVLVVVEILGELLERQAVRRMAAGTLTDDEVRRLGASFTALHRRVDELYDEVGGLASAGSGRSTA